MKKTVLAAIGAFMLLGASSSTSSASKERRYVINVSGAVLHKQPSFKSATVRTIPVGSAVEIQETLASTVTQPISAGFGLPGRWMKVTTPSSAGYIFSADLTAIRPVIEKGIDGLRHINLLGAKKGTREEHPKTGELRTITEYANSTYVYTSFDSCFDHDYTFRKLALHEVYHQMINSYSGYDGQKLVQPTLISRKGNVYTFTCGFGSSDAAQELKLTVNKNGSIVISSYDCT
ncbi:hypothetical protein [Hymenobacter canadensis]|uniref:SH3 domain-containing protein n=1 Tax=Hymenobacter canadensis TaxID=2999067 RepID=A0ABY7LQ06_9BACT|nr:hypothetical protein [Hymenobacter canadensis]WBA41924.1 hypothetical protein O3303_19205 [Hymenobacter canadensis]